jgi:L-fuculose-phosphate aldolase
MMEPGDLVITDVEGNRISGERKPSSEMGMHLLIYSQRPDINSICHAHPPVATGFAAAGIPLNKALLCEAIVALGSVPVAKYGEPGTPELVEAIEPLVHDYDAILLANHGVVTYGPDLLTAFSRMETTEHYAWVSLVTELLGKQSLLSTADVERLFAARARYGLHSVACPSPETLITSESTDSDRVTLSRRELEALVEEAVRHDRAHR